MDCSNHLKQGTRTPIVWTVFRPHTTPPQPPLTIKGVAGVPCSGTLRLAPRGLPRDPHQVGVINEAPGEVSTRASVTKRKWCPRGPERLTVQPGPEQASRPVFM